MLDADKARKGLQDILNRKEYTIYYDEKKSLIETWWEQAKEWIADQLAKLFPSYEATNAAAGPVLFVVIALVVIALGIIAFIIARNTRRARKFREQSPLQSMKEMDWTSEMHMAEASKQGDREQYSIAARHLFLALLLFFHQKEWLEARIWKTNWEYYDELRKVNQSWASQFYHLARIFDEVTYGERKLEKEEYEEFHREVMQWLGERGNNGVVETDIK